MKTGHTEYSPDFKDSLGSAMAASRTSDFSSVLSICSTLDREGPLCKPVQILLVEALWKTGRINEALVRVRQATENFPHSELLSLLLFQILIEQDKVEEAKSEVLRFYLIHASSDYDGIIQDYGWDELKYLMHKNYESEKRGPSEY